MLESRSRTFSSPLLLVLLLALGCGGKSLSSDPETGRRVTEGEVIGTTIEDGRVHAWLGLPFAAPPVGPLRWRATEKPEPWEGTRQALRSGSECAQLGGDPIKGREDCLYLDIFSPTRIGDESGAEGEGGTPKDLPVMFWIHGGGNSLGSGDMLPPQGLARDNGVVVVTINYRLGIFGWLAHPALRASASGPEDASGNFATLDMIRALEWVQENIAAFGGNPNNVTIFGESAGGLNVYSLLISPLAKGLFHAAISESGNPTSMLLEQAENYTDDPEAPGLPGSSGELVLAMLSQEGLAGDRDSAKALVAQMAPEEIETFLREQSTRALLAPFAALMDSTMPMYFSANIIRDGHVISDGDPLDLLGTPGAYNEVPFIAGTNREETKLFTAMDSPHVKTTFGLPSGFINERLYDVEGEYGGLMWRAEGADQPVSAMRRAQGASVWAYRFDWDEEPKVLGLDLSKLIGAGHAMEMMFVFGLTDLGFANRFIYADVPSAERLSEQMRSYWAEFAYHHKPGKGQMGDLPEWPAWGLGSRDPKYLIFDSDRDGGIELGYDQIDRAYVLNRAGQDPRLFNDEERCSVYKNLLQWSDALTVEDYMTRNDGQCSPWPLESRFAFPSLSHEN